MDQQQAFIQALKRNEDDLVTRLIYADWLEEHDQPEEAERMRQWTASKEWLTNWVRSINYDRWEVDEDYEEILDAQGNRVPAKEDNLGRPHTYGHAIDAGYAALRNETYCWNTDAGQDYFFSWGNRSFPGTPEERWYEWRQHWSIVTGVKFPPELSEAHPPPFRCAC